ncbi:MAG TPA: CvpA family protein [Candidatus Hypogeohydataceae bacterium YC41]
MNWLDSIFIGFLCMTAALGFLSGFLWQVYSLICLVASYFSATFLHSFLIGPLSTRFSPGSSLLMSHIITFVATFALLYSLGLLMRRVLNLYPGFWGGLFGAFLGLFQGMLLCGVIAVGLMEYSSNGLRQEVESSAVVSAFAKGTKVFYAIIPGDIKRGFGETLGRARSFIEGEK